MKKIIFLTLLISIFCFNAKAYKEIKSEMTVKGTAKDVTIDTKTGIMTVTCDQSIWDCYTQKTTVIEQDGIVIPQPEGDPTEITITDNKGTHYRITGGLIHKSGGVYSNGDTQHSFQFSNLQVINE